MKLNGQNRGNRFIPPVLKWPAGCGTGLDLLPHHPDDRRKAFQFQVRGEKLKNIRNTILFSPSKRIKEIKMFDSREKELYLPKHRILL